MKREQIIELMQDYFGFDEISNYALESGCYLSNAHNNDWLSLNTIVDFIQTYADDIAYLYEAEE